MANPVTSFFKDERADPRSTNPVISEALNSVRAYTWEVHFDFQDLGVVGNQTDLILAAKQVSEAGFAVGDIEVNRVNDKVFYPGRPEQDELTITFDNVYKGAPAMQLWQWFQTILLTVRS